MAEAIYLCEVEGDNQPLIEGVRAILINSDDGALVNATATLTFSDVGSEGETITIDGTTYTLRATPAAANDIDIGASATATAANVAAAIDGSGTPGTEYFAGTESVDTVTASASSGVITITAVDQGPAGNGILMSTDSDDASFSVDRLVGGGLNTAGSARITLGDAMTADEVIKIGSVTYTFVASPSEANDVDIGADAAGSAANLAAAINAGAGAGTAYGTGTVAHPKVTATVSDAVVTVTHRQEGSDTDDFDELGAYSPVAPVQLSTTGDVTFGSLANGRTSGGTYGDLAVEAAAACNRAFDIEIFPSDYFDKFTEIDDLSSGPLADDQTAFVISHNSGVIQVSAP